MVYLNIFFMSVVVVFIVDVSGVMSEIREAVNAHLKRDPDARIKPFDCSTCMTWWTGLFYLLFAGITWPRVAAVALAAAVSRNIGEMVFIIEDFGASVLDRLSKKIELWKTRK